MTILRLKAGWYSFKQIPQEGRYIKIDRLNCGSDKDALKTARKCFGKREYTIQEAQ
jgi:hypothetical protein